MNTSLDGYIADRDGDFTGRRRRRSVFAAITELERPVGTYLYGRRMYETMAVWDTAHLEPGGPASRRATLELEREFAALWRAADKIVFSTTLPQRVDLAHADRTRVRARPDSPSSRRRANATSRSVARTSRRR